MIDFQLMVSLFPFPLANWQVFVIVLLSIMATSCEGKEIEGKLDKLPLSTPD